MSEQAVHANAELPTPAAHYTLRCRGCEAVFEDDGFILECPRHHEPALMAVEYRGKRFEPDPGADGLFRYRRWLPGTRILPGTGGSVTYRSERLNRQIGLPNLWIVFNGYWPEKGAMLETATFKELEVWAVLARIPQHHKRVLVVASAGNTAAAFARVCSANKIRCLVIVPESGFPCLQFPDIIDPCVKCVSLTGRSDYFDAIALSNVSRESMGSSRKEV